MNQSANGNTGTNLQGASGAVQPGAAGLQQQQTTSNNQYQNTAGLQQDALGPEAYRTYDTLTVQGGASSQAVPAVTTGRGSMDVFIVSILFLVAFAAVLLWRYKKTPRRATLEPVGNIEGVNSTEDLTVVSETVKSVKKKKHQPVKVKPKKKAAAKAKKRKK
jgi:hypothetical protein